MLSQSLLKKLQYTYVDEQFIILQAILNYNIQSFAYLYKPFYYRVNNCDNGTISNLITWNALGKSVSLMTSLCVLAVLNITWKQKIYTNRSITHN